jgi:YVTN family beta-propeller protein
VFDRVRASVVAFTVAIVLGGASARSDSLGATAGISPLATAQQLKTSGEPSGVAVDPQNGRAYVTDLEENALFVFDLSSGSAIAYVPTGRQPSQVVLLGTRAIVSNFSDASITVVDTSTNRAVKTLSVGGLGVAVNSQTKRLYAAEGSRISVLDTENDALLTTIEAPAGANLWGVAVDPATNRIYATDVAAPRVLVYDGAKNTLIGEVTLDAPARFAIAVGPLGRVYVASYTDQSPQLSVIDGSSLKIITRAPTSAFARSVVVDAGGLAYISGGTDGSVTAVDTSSRASTKVSLAGPAGAVSSSAATTAVAINPASGELVVVTAGGVAPPARPFGDPSPVVKP